MPAKASDIYSYIDLIAPFDTCESWDKSGFIAGDPESIVTNAVVCLDPSITNIKKAAETGAELLITHHPIIWDPLTKVLPGSPVYELIRSGMSVICAHTNWDDAFGGVADTLCDILGIYDVGTVVPCLRAGKTDECDARALAQHVSDVLKAPVKAAFTDQKKCSKVAVCPGGGASLIPDALAAGADVFITGDAKHNDFIDAVANGISLIAAGHFETEDPAAKVLCDRLSKQFPQTKFTFISNAPAIFFSPEK